MQAILVPLRLLRSLILTAGSCMLAFITVAMVVLLALNMFFSFCATSASFAKKLLLDPPSTWATRAKKIHENFIVAMVCPCPPDVERRSVMCKTKTKKGPST